MKNIILPAGFLFCLVCFTYCSSTTKTATPKASPVQNNSQTSLDWQGIYRGVLPCADCEGIQTTLYLNKDLSYRLHTKYLGKEDTIYAYSGKFSWNAQGNTITLDNKSKPFINYLVGENTVTQLDRNGKKITGNNSNNYTLSKTNYDILEKYWKLTELNGKPVLVDGSFFKEPHIIFKGDNRFTGNGGCNSISGTYKLKNPNKITISQAFSTRMACPRLDMEALFLQILQKADNYYVIDDTLILNKEKMAPLARFKIVYMK